jgi:hypothetical protein
MSGSVTPLEVGLEVVTNNLTELIAVLHALEALPDGWQGHVYTDSLVTLRRFQAVRPKFTGIPLALQDRVRQVRARLGSYGLTLLAGHPSRQDLMRGHKPGGLPVSSHNKRCDELCKRESMRLLQGARLGRGPIQTGS